MLFGLKLEHEVHQPWKSHYIDYESLKTLLKEGSKKWVEDDEFKFASELNKNLEKVYSFLISTYSEIKEEINNLEKLSEFESLDKFDVLGFQNKLEDLLDQSKLLDQFARLNYTGFIKIVKKHDRLHPSYSVKPLLMVQLEKLPFHSEDFSPLLHKLTTLYSFLRENFKINEYSSNLSSVPNEEYLNYKTFKFWVHPDNLLLLQYEITANYLPPLNSDNLLKTSNKKDTTTSCLYFDNKSFDLYNAKLEKITNAKTLRLKWNGKLADKPDISIEEKFIDENEQLNELKFPIKEKYLNSFIKGDLQSEKLVKKLQERGDSEIALLKSSKELKDAQRLIIDEDLEPTLRTNFKRLVYQLPGDDKIRIFIDTDIIFIREDSFDEERPIRNPNSWHRADIDAKIEDPFSLLRKGEFSKFPYAVMDVKVKNSVWNSQREEYEWIHDLINSHLVKEVPNFSKFIQGISSLFTEDDKLDNIPFWFHDLDSDIRKDPKKAYEDEQVKLKMKREEDEKLDKFKSILSPAIKPAESSKSKQQIQREASTSEEESFENVDSPNFNVDEERYGSKLDVDSEEDEIELPPGVKEPTTYLKNAGPLKIEPKVGLANERTYLRWLHVTLLFATFTFIIESSVKKAHFELLASALSYFYFFITLFCGGWGYYIYVKRTKLIHERSGKHLDGILGPIVVACALILALTINFIFSLKNSLENEVLIAQFQSVGSIHRSVHGFLLSLFGF